MRAIIFSVRFTSLRNTCVLVLSNNEICWQHQAAPQNSGRHKGLTEMFDAVFVTIFVRRRRQSGPHLKRRKGKSASIDRGRQVVEWDQTVLFA